METEQGGRSVDLVTQTEQVSGIRVVQFEFVRLLRLLVVFVSIARQGRSATEEGVLELGCGRCDHMEEHVEHVHDVIVVTGRYLWVE